jgi:hypothetical protein
LTLLVALAVLLLSLPGYLELFRGSLSVPTLFEGFTQAQQRVWLGFIFVLSTGATLLSIGLAVLVYLRKTRDRMAVFFSFYLLLYASS